MKKLMFLTATMVALVGCGGSGGYGESETGTDRSSSTPSTASETPSDVTSQTPSPESGTLSVETNNLPSTPESPESGAAPNDSKLDNQDQTQPPALPEQGANVDPNSQQPPPPNP